MGRSTSVRQWILAVAGLALIGGAGFVVWRGSVPERAAAKAPSATSSAQPQLSVDRNGGALRVHWDPQASALRSAGRARLIIADGPRETRLDLDSRDLRAGAASYWPESRDVSFRLELDGATVASVRAPAMVAENRPSPFKPSAAPPRKAAAPVKRVQAQRPVGPVASADRSKPHRSFVSKIPLLRRLRKHRD